MSESTGPLCPRYSISVLRDREDGDPVPASVMLSVMKWNKHFGSWVCQDCGHAITEHAGEYLLDVLIGKGVKPPQVVAATVWRLLAGGKHNRD